MYIRIINKNRIANNNTFEDFQKYGIDEGCVYVNNYNEELDSFKCRVSNLTSKIDIEPFDRVAIYHSDDTLMNVMDVNTWECTMNGYVGDATYSYDISLFSMTKELENVILPDLSITPHAIGTKLKVYQYIHRYVDLYFTKHRTSNGIATIEYDSTIDTKFNNDAPELQWNAPTLREVLTTLMMTKDCIPVIKWMNNKPTLSYIDLTKKEQPITNYNYIQTSQSADNYVSELRMDMKNVLQTKVNEISNTVTTSEYIPITTNGYVVAENNFYLETQYPILKIKHLWLFIEFCDKNNNTTISHTIKSDLCNINTSTGDVGRGSLVKEKAEYDVLKVLNRALLFGNLIPVENGLNRYQNYCIYYTRGSNKIDGFSKITKPNIDEILFTSGITTLNFHKLITLLDNDYSASSHNKEAVLGFQNAYLNTYFQIEYETQYDQVFQASKEGKQHHRVVADNQTNSWVDATTQGNLEYQKANRLGNEIMLINQRTTNTPIACGDFLGDNIVYKVEQQIYSDFINVNAYATKNYILQDYWTGINSKIRTWVNAQEEAFRRNELKKYYCEFSYDEHNDSTIVVNNLSSKMISTIDNQAHNKPIKYVGVRTYLNADDTSFLPTGYDYYHYNVLTRAIGKSIVLSFGFNDNWIAGKNQNDAITTTNNLSQETVNGNFRWTNLTDYGTSSEGTVGGMPLDSLAYCDNNGEFIKIEYDYADDIYIAPSIRESDIVGVVNDITPVANNIKSFIGTVWKKPLAPYGLISSFVRFFDTLNFYKDNKEIPTINTQFEFTSDTSDIIVTNKWVNLNKWVANYDTAKSYTIYEAPVSDWNCRSTALPSSASQLVGATLETDSTRNNRAKITLRNTTDDKAYYIVLDNEVALAFKGKSLSTDVWLNVLSIRDTNIYNAQGVITGEI